MFKLGLQVKWLSGGKAMSELSDRYGGDPVSADEAGGPSKIAPLQVVWFNGVGFETWENIWGARHFFGPDFHRF